MSADKSKLATTENKFRGTDHRQIKRKIFPPHFASEIGSTNGDSYHLADKDSEQLSQLGLLLSKAVGMARLGWWDFAAAQPECSDYCLERRFFFGKRSPATSCWRQLFHREALYG